MLIDIFVRFNALIAYLASHDVNLWDVMAFCLLVYFLGTRITVIVGLLVYFIWRTTELEKQLAKRV